jgi:YD repeat-containing protein
VTERATTGRVTHVRRPAGRATAYTYDAAGNLSEVLHNDHERTSYRYRSDGALLEASTATTTVLFERDALGRVLCETQDGHQVLSTLDALGQRLGLTSSLGASVTLERDALGQVRRTQAGTWQSLVGRDAEGLELHRQLSGDLRQEWQHDALGRPTSQRLSAGGQLARQRRYHWQAGDHLTHIEDSQLGPTHFTYDAGGSLASATYADGEQLLRQPNAVGNLFRTSSRTDRTYSKGGQLRAANGTRYGYDEEGNLVRKTLPSGQV